MSFGPVDAASWSRSAAMLSSTASGALSRTRLVLDAQGPRDHRVRIATTGVGEDASGPDGHRADGGLIIVGDGDSDTSAFKRFRDEIAAAYAIGGGYGLGRLRSDRCFVLWDGRACALWLGAGPYCLRTLAYRWDGSRFLASSRAVAVLAGGQEPGRWDRRYVADALAGFWTAPPDGTAFVGLHRMVAGQLLGVTASGIEHVGGARHRPLRIERGNQRSIASEVAMRIETVVRERFDPGTCCLSLSGGIDSGVIACAAARGGGPVHAFTLVSSDCDAATPADPDHWLRSIPEIRVHAVAVPREPHARSELLDDPLAVGPALQSGRNALMAAAREAGFRRVFDGEGGDEIFDLVRRPADAIYERDLCSIALSAGAAPRRVVRDWLAGNASRPILGEWLARVHARSKAARPWLKPEFWASAGFGAAWQGLKGVLSLHRVHLRMPLALGWMARHLRAQELIRASFGLDGSSPLTDARVIEYVAGLRTRAAAYDPRRAKLLLWRVAQNLRPGVPGWRPKREPLYDALVRRELEDDSKLQRASEVIRQSAMLREYIDVDRLRDTVVDRRARSSPVSAAGNYAVQLYSILDWMDTIGARYAIS